MKEGDGIDGQWDERTEEWKEEERKKKPWVGCPPHLDPEQSEKNTARCVTKPDQHMRWNC